MLNEFDRTFLEAFVKQGATQSKSYKRAAALLELDKGKKLKDISKQLHVTPAAVSQWGKKYQSRGLAMLQDAARSGRPSEYSGVAAAKITALACSQAPEGYGNWSLRLLAGKAVELQLVEQISYGTVRNILKKTNCSLT